MTMKQITKKFCEATRTLMNLGMTEEDAKAKVKEIMNRAVTIVTRPKKDMFLTMTFVGGQVTTHHINDAVEAVTNQR